MGLAPGAEGTGADGGDANEDGNGQDGNAGEGGLRMKDDGTGQGRGSTVAASTRLSAAARAQLVVDAGSRLPGRVQGLEIQGRRSPVDVAKP